MEWQIKTVNGKPFYESENGEYRIMNAGKKGGDGYQLFIRGHHGMHKFRNTYCTHIHQGTLDDCKGRAT